MGRGRTPGLSPLMAGTLGSATWTATWQHLQRTKTAPGTMLNSVAKAPGSASERRRRGTLAFRDRERSSRAGMQLGGEHLPNAQA